ncbi:phosphotransferase family protein [Streptomyces antibioticus]|uniref:phosphotransferase family protein n=1 Tax=Streptomyces antibioticus TaxID=1890 RepID=UPI0015C44269|nr:phosphotransferase [Streptomyces antibioticus]
MTTPPSPRRHLTTADLAPLARAAAGGHRTLSAAARLTGGTSKGVYRLVHDDGSTAIAYVWSPQEDYWARPDTTDRPEPAAGLALFRSAHRRLTALGVRVPRILFLDADGTHLPACAAVVEDVAGPTLETALRDDPDRARPALERLARMLEAMRARTAPGHGGVTSVEEGGPAPDGVACARAVADRALADIDEVAARDPRARRARARLRDRIRELHGAVRPRPASSLVHGELGPDHVLLAADGEPVLIDIEDLGYCDAEREHAFLELRFGPWYDVLRAPGLDPDRLALHRLALHLSLVAGPLRLLDGDFPDPAPMREIAEFNLLRALDLAGGAGAGPRG